MDFSKFKLHELVKAIRVCLKRGAPFAPGVYLGLAITPTAASAEPAANTLPVIDKVSAGDVSVSQSASALDINQSSSRAIVDWQSFDLGRDAIVRFNQPNSSASTLNRINGSNASQIFGRIEAPGEVILVNPYGMYFSRTAKVDVGSIIASVNSISAENYLAGNYLFERDGATGAIVNDGVISASLGGYIAMLAPEVRNNGIMLAQMGTIAMASGDRVSLDFGPNSKLNSLTASQSTIDALIENKSAVAAPGGLIILSASGVSEIARGVINNSGTLDLSDGGLNFVNEGGRLLISGDRVNLSSTQKIDASIDSDVALSAANQQAGAIDISATETVAVSGEINASANQAGTVSIAAGEGVGLNDAIIRVEGDVKGGEIAIEALKSSAAVSSIPTEIVLSGSTQLSVASQQGVGGIITLQGDAISLNDTTSLIATGVTGGGNVLVGGDWQGGASDEYRVFADPDALYQATSVTMLGNALIDASATQNGDGGTIVLWSDVSNPQSVTTVSGSLVAQGGELSGDGGYIETSGASLDFAGISISTLAANGSAGEWLIDPTETIGSSSDGTYTINTDAEVSEIVDALATSNVRVLTGGDLNIAANIYSASDNALTLESKGANVYFKANVRAKSIKALAYKNILTYGSNVVLTTLGGDLVLSASVGASGRFDFQEKLTIRTNGGNVTIGGGNRLGTGDTTLSGMTAMHFQQGVVIQTRGGSVNLRGVVTGSSANGSGIRFEGGALIDTRLADGTGGGNISIYGDTKSEDYALSFESRTTLNSGTGSISIEGYSSRLTANQSGAITFEDIDNVTHTLTSASNDTQTPAISLYGVGGELPVRLSNVSIEATGTAGISVRALDVDHAGTDAGSGGSSGLRFYETASITSNSGDISLYGETTSDSQGVQFWSDTTINSGTGKVLIEGNSVRVTQNGSSAVKFEESDSTHTYSHSITSASADAEAISIVGSGGEKSLSLANLKLHATGDGGGIKLQSNIATWGDLKGPTEWGIYIRGDNEYLAASGPINILAAHTQYRDINNTGTLWLGSKAGTPVSTSTSDIYIEVGKGYYPGLNIATNGTFTLSPSPTYDASGSLTGYEFVGSPSTSIIPFNLNGTVLSGLTYGRPEMTKGTVYVDSPLTVNGPVNLYAYELLNVRENIDTSDANGAITLAAPLAVAIGLNTKDIELKSGSGDITISAYNPKFRYDASSVHQSILTTTGVISILPPGDLGFYDAYVMDSSVVAGNLVANAITTDAQGGTVDSNNAGLVIANVNDLGGLVIGKESSSGNGVAFKWTGDFIINGPISLLGLDYELNGIETAEDSSPTIGSRNVSDGDITVKAPVFTLSSGDISVLSGQSLNVTATSAISIAGNIVGAGSVSFESPSTLINSDFSALSGDLALTGGVLEVQSSSFDPHTDLDVSLSSGAEFKTMTALGSATDPIYLNSISGDGSVYLYSSSYVSLGSVSGNIPIEAYSTELILGANNASSVIAENISGSVGNLIKRGTGSVTLSGANTLPNKITVEDGALVVDGSDALGGPGQLFVHTGATLDLVDAALISNYTLLSSGARLKADGTSSVANNIHIEGQVDFDVSAGSALVFDKSIYSLDSASTTTSVSKLGDGRLDYTLSPRYWGGTTVAAGTLSIHPSVAGEEFYIGAAVVDAGAVLDIVDAKVLTSTVDDTSIYKTLIFDGGSLSSSGTSQLSGVLTLGGDTSMAVASGDLTIVTELSDGGNGFGITKLGSGTLTLAGDDTYTGATNIDSGLLVISSDAPVQASSGYFGAGSLRVESASDSFSSTFSNSGWNFASTLGALTLGKLSNTADISIDDAVNAAGPVTVFGGDIRLNATVTAGVDSNIALVASSSFVNNVGAGVLNVSGTGQWYVYAADGGRLANTYNGLDSLNQAVWGETYASLAPENVGSTYSGNRYIFAAAPVVGTNVVITTTDLSKEYGTLVELNDSSSVNYLQPYSFDYEFAGGALDGAYLADGGTASAITSLSEAFSVMPVFVAGNSTVYGDVGSENITITEGVANANFSITYRTGQDYGQLSVTPKALTVSGITAFNKTYNADVDAVVDASGVVFDGLIAGDAFSIESVIGVFADKNVGTAKTVTLTSTYTGDDVGNYAIADQTTASADITAKALSVRGISAENRVYNADVDAVVDASGVVFDGLIAGDAFSIESVTGVFADKNVGTAKTVTLTSAYTGDDVGNYAITHQTTTSADITAKALSVSGITAENRVYNADVDAVVDASGVVFDGLIAGDAVTLSVLGAFTDAGVGTDKTVLLANTYGGADIANYTIVDQISSLADITEAETTGNATGGDTTGGDSTVGDTTGGDTTGDTASGDTSGGDTTTGDTLGGDTEEEAGGDAEEAAAAAVEEAARVAAQAAVAAAVAGQVDPQPTGNAQPNLSDESTVNDSLENGPPAETVATNQSTSEESSTSEQTTDDELAGDSADSSSEEESEDEEATGEAGENVIIADSTSNFLPSKPLDTITVDAGSSFSFETPASTFTHVNPSEKLTFSAAMADGSPLPNWVKFDAQTQTFSGVTPQGVEQVLDVVIKAVDTSSQVMQSKLQVDIK